MMTKTDEIKPHPFDDDSDALEWLQQVVLMPHGFELTMSTRGGHVVIHLFTMDDPPVRAHAATLRTTLQWLRHNLRLRQEQYATGRSPDSFYTWWVSEKGGPPNPDEYEQFQIAKAAWKAARA